MPTDPTPPCVGSLWQHKDGERAFVFFVGVTIWCCKTPFNPDTDDRDHRIYRSDWSAWAADAVRIDNAPRGEERRHSEQETTT